MKFTVGLVAMLVAATWCGSAAAAPSSATSTVSAMSAAPATSAVSASSSGESPAHAKYVKDLAHIQKMLDDVKDSEDKQTELEKPINEQIKNLKTWEPKTKKYWPTNDSQMKIELSNPNPIPTALTYKKLKLQIITGRTAIAQKLGPDGAYGKCQVLAKTDPKDDDLKAQGSDLKQKVLTKYESVLKGIATLYDMIKDTKDEDDVYHQIQAVDRDNPAATAYFEAKKKKASGQK